MTSVAGEQQAQQSPKDLATLRDDPAFREFFKLQEGFEWNGELCCVLFCSGEGIVSGWEGVLMCEGFSGDKIDCLFGEAVGEGE